jgi:hypothetical protein
MISYTLNIKQGRIDMLSLPIGTLVIVLISILFIVVLWLIFIQVKLSRFIKRQQEIFSGTGAKNLEEALRFYVSEIKSTKNTSEKLKKISNHLNTMAESSVQKIGLVRFNPFSDTGGNQSFAIALLDYFNNGVIISSLHGRAGTRIYAKPVVAGKSKYNLSAEEIEAIKKAVHSKAEEIKE